MKGEALEQSNRSCRCIISNASGGMRSDRDRGCGCAGELRRPGEQAGSATGLLHRNRVKCLQVLRQGERHRSGQPDAKGKRQPFAEGPRCDILLPGPP